MATLNTIRPSGDGTRTTVIDQSGGTTNLWDAVNDVTADDATTHINADVDSGGTIYFTHTGTNADFDSMDTLSYFIRLSQEGTRTDDTLNFYIQVYAADESTSYTVAETVTGHNNVSGYQDYTGSFTLNAAGLAASKAEWDASRIRLTWIYTKDKGPDGIAIDVTQVYLTGTYTGSTNNNLLADDIVSGTTTSRPTLTGKHALTADSVQGGSTVTTPTVIQIVDMTATSIQSGSTVTTPAAVVTSHLTATSVVGGSSVSTVPVGQEHALLNTSVVSGSTVTQPTAGEQVNEVNLTATSVQSGATVSTVAVGQEHALLSTSVQSGATVSTPAAAITSNLTATSVQSGPTVSTAPVGQEHALLATSIASAPKVSTPAVAETVQLLLPEAPTANNGWTNELGGGGAMASRINELVANDSDYIRSPLQPATNAIRFPLSNVVPIPTAEGAQRVRYRYGKDAADSHALDLTVRLIEGASTVIASWSHTDIPSAVTAANQVLTAPQKASITNYDDLFIEFEANS